MLHYDIGNALHHDLLRACPEVSQEPVDTGESAQATVKAKVHTGNIGCEQLVSGTQDQAAVIMDFNDDGTYALLTSNSSSALQKIVS